MFIMHHNKIQKQNAICRSKYADIISKKNKCIMNAIQITKIGAVPWDASSKNKQF